MNNNIKILYLITFIILVYESCAPAVHVEGLYTNVFVKGIAGEEFKFTREPDTFEYDSRTEGAIKKYSIGTWEQNRKTIFLNGFNDKNINLLDVESNVEDFQKETRSKIIVQYDDAPFDPFTKVELVLNEHSKVRIQGDTAFFPDQKIRTIQVKSFLVHEGFLLGAPPCIDTLFSPKIEVTDLNQPKLILLKVNVDQNDFYRVSLTDTLVIKNARTLIWQKKEFRKIKNKAI